MYSFLILSIPACIAIYCFLRKDYKASSFIPPILWGMFIGIVAFFVEEFFILSDYDVPASYFSYVLHLARETIIPIAALTVFWLLISKDDGRYNTVALFPLIASFYAIYTPYGTISSLERHAFFLLFIKPPVIAGTVIICCALTALIKEYFISKKYLKALLFLLLFVAALFAEPLIQALWYFKIGSALYLVLSFIVVLLAFVTYKMVFTQKALDKAG